MSRFYFPLINKLVIADDHHQVVAQLVKQKRADKNHLVFSLITNEFRRRKNILNTSSNILENCILYLHFFLHYILENM